MFHDYITKHIYMMYYNIINVSPFVTFQVIILLYFSITRKHCRSQKIDLFLKFTTCFYQTNYCASIHICCSKTYEPGAPAAV